MVRLTFFLKKEDFIYLFLERGEGREKEGERNIDRLCLTCPQMETWPTTQGSAQTGNRTSDLLFSRWCPIHWTTPVRALPFCLYQSHHVVMCTWYMEAPYRGLPKNVKILRMDCPLRVNLGNQQVMNENRAMQIAFERLNQKRIM